MAQLTTTLSTSSFYLSQGQAVTPFKPVTASGGTTPYSWTITPPLPSNLNFNTNNGQVSGIPITLTDSTSYTITVRDHVNTTSSKTFSLGVVVPPFLVNVPIQAQIGTPFLSVVNGGPSSGTVTVSNLTVAGTTPSTYSLNVYGSRAAPFVLPAPNGSQTVNVLVTDANGTVTASVNRAIIAYYNLLSVQILYPNNSFTVDVTAPAYIPVSATGGDGTLTWSISPALPTGVNFNTATGQISGHPTVLSTSSQYTITVSDISGQSLSQTILFAVVPLPLLLSENFSLATQSFTANQAITPYTPINASGGYGTKVWSTSPTLPSGLTINSSNGQISGTPTVIKDYTTYNVVVTDQAGQTSSLPISLAIFPTVLTIITPLTDQILTDNQPVTLTPVAGGGFGQFSWTILPSLPAGLSLNASTGQISGTPTELKSAAVYTLTVTDQSNQSASQTLSISVIPLSNLSTIKVSDLNLIKNTLMTTTAPVFVYGGYGTKTWSIAPALPAGLSFNTSTGQVSGTPSNLSSAETFTITVTDTSSPPQVAINTFNLTVVNPLAAAYTVPGVTSRTLNKNEFYSFTPVSESGGLPPYSFTISPPLPAGLNFNSSDGLLYGTPSTTSTTFPYTITVSDQLNETSSEPFTLGVGGYGTSAEPAGPILDLITTKTTVAAGLYNQLAANITTLMEPSTTGYGFTGAFLDSVHATTSTIAWVDWQKLFYEANIINTHITGKPITLPNGVPINYSTATVLRADFVDAVIAATNNAVINRYSVDPSQLGVMTITDESNSVWDSTIISTVKLVSGDADTTQYFFNLGSYIQPTLTRGIDSGETDPALASDWRDLIDAANTLMKQNPYNRSLYMSGSHHFQTDTNIHGDFISLDYTKISATEIDVTVTLNVGTTGLNADSAAPKSFNVINTVNTYYSKGVLNAVTPMTKTVTTSFGQGGQSITPTVGVLTANTYRLTYDMHQYDESARQTIVLTNSGNRPVRVFSILMPDNRTTTGPVPNLYRTWTTDPTSPAVVTIEPNTSVHFDVSYVSQHLGIFNNFIHIFSDADNNKGSTVIKTVQTVAGPVFRPQLGTTSTYNVNINNYHVVSSALNIQTTPYVPLASWTTNTNHSANLPHTNITWIDPNGVVYDLTNHSEIFKIKHLKAGPYVSFNPESFTTFYKDQLELTNIDRLQTVITATISVDCIPRGVPGAPADLNHPTTTSTTIVMNLDLPSNQHLGEWLSPTSLDNCVVGMSYDIIGFQQYLTIGVGLEASLLNNGQLTGPLPDVIADANYNFNYQNLANGPDADPQWAHGIPLHKSTGPLWTADDPISGFLYEYGVWFNSDLSSPHGKLVNRRYLISAPVDGYYDWKFAADLIGYFAIDGNILGDTRRANTVEEALKGYTGKVFLTRGQHVLQLAGANIFNVTDTNPNPQVAVGLTISQSSNGQHIWTSLDPVRAGPTFAGWSEVYRIPIVSAGTGVPQTYYSGCYVVKDSGNVFGQYRYQDFFGDYSMGSQGAGSLFVIHDDGYGNLTIRNQYKTILTGDASTEQTTDQLQYISYYYDTLDFNTPSGQNFENHARRVHNLDPGPQGDGSQCHQFLGFTADGVVVTRLTRYPGYQNYDPVPRFLIGSLNLGTTGVPTGATLKTNLLSLALNPALWAIGIGYLLWTGGIANYLLCTAAGASLWGSIEIGTFLAQFEGGGQAVALIGQIFDYGASLVGEMIGTSDALATAAAAAEIGEGLTFLGVVGAALPYVAIAALVFMYGGQIWHAITGIVDSVISFVSNVVSSVFSVFCCFDPEAQVTMADGTQKKIKDIVVGDQVMSKYGTPNTVLGIETPMLGSRLMYKFNDRWAFVSEEHPLLTTEGWAAFNPDSYAVEKEFVGKLGKIEIGTTLVTRTGTEVVTSIETESRPYDYLIYNLILDGDHTFIVEGIVVHNKSVICSKLYELGILPYDIYQADERFGKLLRQEHMYIYEGYRAWADTVVDWMSGSGPEMILWEKDPVRRQERITKFVTNWAAIIAVPWAEHMAYRMGVREKDNYTGRVLMYTGIPLCAAVGKWQQWFGKNTRPAGWVKGAVIIGTAGIFRVIAGTGKLLSNTKNLIKPIKLLDNTQKS